MTELQQILEELSFLDKDNPVYFNNGVENVCSVVFEDTIVSDSMTSIETYAVTYFDNKRGYTTDHMRNIDVVAMFVYTELKKHKPQTILN